MEMEVLDKGKIALIESLGNDKSIVEAARVSYGKGTKHFRPDIDLINYLMRHGHESPFEFVTFKFYVKAPIFIARQWMRYRSASYAELSGRYSEIGDDYYVPGVQRLSDIIKNEDVPELVQADIVLYNSRVKQRVSDYLEVLDREIANRNHNLFKYTEFYFQVNLRNLFNLLIQRLDSHAQWEFRQYADAILELITPIVPSAIQAFKDYKLNSVTLSAKEIEMIQIISTIDLNVFDRIYNSNCSKGEMKEAKEKLKKLFNIQ